MTGHQNHSSAAFDRKEEARAGSPAESIEDTGETLSAIEQMLANPDDRLCGRYERDAGAPSMADRCAIMRSMLVPLETLTPAGQRYQMSRLIDVLAAETDGAGGRLGAANCVTLGEQLARLRQEAERAWPNVGSFAHRTEALITLLESVA